MRTIVEAARYPLITRPQSCLSRTRRRVIKGAAPTLPERGSAVVTVLFLAACALLASVSAASTAERQALKIGDSPPRFTLQDLSGKTVTVPDDLKGKAVIIHFWADWCTYCLDEMPALESLYKRYQQRGLVIYAVNVGQGPEAARAFMNRVKISYPVLLDITGKTAKQYNVIGLPRTFFLDRQGLIKYKLLGDASEEMLLKLILNTL